MKNAGLHELERVTDKTGTRKRPAPSKFRPGVVGSCSESHARRISQPLESAGVSFMPATTTSVSNATVDALLERFIAPLFAGERSGARAIVAEAFEEGLSAEEILMQLIWPTMDKIQGMYRADRINTGVHHMAARLLRMLADQLALRLPRAE